MSRQHTGIIEAREYHENSQLQWERAMEAIHRFLWQGTERVLDIGCGDGKISAFLARKFPHSTVMGIDLSPEMILFASQKYPRHQFPNLFFLEGDASNLPFHAQFDVVASFCCLHWIKDQPGAMQQIYNALVPGGKCLFVIPERHASNLTPITDQLTQRPHWIEFFPEQPHPMTFYSRNEYLEMLEGAGFEIEWSSSSTHTTTFAHRQALTSWLRPATPFLHKFPEALQEQFRSELTDALLPNCTLLESGEIFFGSPNAVIVATKPAIV